MPLSYRRRDSNLAEFRITATLQQHDEHLGPKQLQVDGLSCCQIGVRTAGISIPRMRAIETPENFY